MGIILEWLWSHEYYAKPEGKDPVGKVFGLAKYGITFGGFCALYDCCLISKTTNFRQCLNTVGFWVVPLAGMCFSFSSVVFILNNVRHKDDKYNYIAGVGAATYVLERWVKNRTISLTTGFLMCLYAIIKKDQVFYGMRPMTEPMQDLNRWTVPWRNLEHRNYLSAPTFKHDKEDYYRNF